MTLRHYELMECESPSRKTCCFLELLEKGILQMFCDLCARLFSILIGQRKERKKGKSKIWHRLCNTEKKNNPKATKIKDEDSRHSESCCDVLYLMSVSWPDHEK